MNRVFHVTWPSKVCHLALLGHDATVPRFGSGNHRQQQLMSVCASVSACRFGSSVHPQLQTQTRQYCRPGCPKYGPPTDLLRKHDVITTGLPNAISAGPERLPPLFNDRNPHLFYVLGIVLDWWFCHQSKTLSSSRVLILCKRWGSSCLWVFSNWFNLLFNTIWSMWGCGLEVFRHYIHSWCSLRPWVDLTLVHLCTHVWGTFPAAGFTSFHSLSHSFQETLPESLLDLSVARLGCSNGWRSLLNWAASP